MNMATLYYLTVFLLALTLINFSPVECLGLKSSKQSRLNNKLIYNYTYQTKYFTQEVDHFGFANNATFQQRYLVSDQYWNRSGGPVFFYTGNEGDITWFCNNTGFMWDIAPEFKAMLVFAEHRYYGESIPYGPSAYEDPLKLNYLTSEQALADFAMLIEHIKQTIPGTQSSKFIAFGGSYGGMLAAWFRMKYPDHVNGALASSAPIWNFNGLVKCNDFTATVTNTFKKSSPQCVKNIRKIWSAINDMAASGAMGLTYLSNALKLCDELKSDGDIDTLKSWIQEAYIDLSMVDYPYPASFLEPLPAWPVQETCKPLSVGPLEGKLLIHGVYKSLNTYFNYTGSTSCLNTSTEATQSLGTKGWSYQACTEMVMPYCDDNVTTMFEPSDWNFTAYSDNCFEKWSVRPKLNWVKTQYGGKNIKSASNIIFSNGLLDPWSSGGVLKSLSSSLTAIIIPNGAHHLDLRSSNPLDPSDVKAAREQEKKILKSWINPVTDDPVPNSSSHSYMWFYHCVIMLCTYIVYCQCM